VLPLYRVKPVPSKIRWHTITSHWCTHQLHSKISTFFVCQ